MAAGGVQWRHEQYETHVELPVGCCSCIVNAGDKNIVCLARLQPPRRVRAKRVRAGEKSRCVLKNLRARLGLRPSQVAGVSGGFGIVDKIQAVR